MKILLSHRFFWPDTPPYALMLRAIGEALARDGHEVSVFSSVPSYRTTGAQTVPRREQLGPLQVRRGWAFQGEKSSPVKRLANLALYCAGLFRAVVTQRPDVVTASTFPPVIAAWAASLAARAVGAKFVYHMQDIHPDVSIYGGGALGKGPLMRLQRWLDNRVLRRSDAIVVLSEDMADSLRQRKLGNLPIHIINNFSLDLFGPGTETDTAAARQDRVIFAGNLGRFQNLDRLIEGVMLALRRFPQTELLLMGDGSELPRLKARWQGNPQLRFLPFLPFDKAKPVIAGSRLGLVSLVPGLIGAAYPSKVMTYLQLGLPMVALVEPTSELARTLTENRLGTVPADDSVAAVAAAVEAALTLSDDDGHISAYYAQTFAAEVAFDKWHHLIAGLGKAA